MYLDMMDFHLKQIGTRLDFFKIFMFHTVSLLTAKYIALTIYVVIS
jgi:hypothetical protein